MNGKVTAVVVTYNRIELLRLCLAALEKQTVPHSLLVVDNASTDGTREFLDAYCAAENRSVVHCSENTGGAGGFSLGIETAIRSGADYVWIMDDDTIPDPDALEELLRAGELLGEGNYGFLSSAVFWKDGTECKMNRQKLKKDFYQQLYLMGEGVIPVDQATFVSLLFPASTVREVGLPIREFFIWGDDIEYTRRIAIRRRMTCCMAAKSHVTHLMGDNNGSSIALDDGSRLPRYRYAFRNEGYLYRKEGLRGICYYFGKCGINILRVLRYAENRRLKRIGIIIAGMVKGLFCFHPKVRYCEKEGEC